MQSFIEDITRLLTLTGNCGRALRRFLSRMQGFTFEAFPRRVEYDNTTGLLLLLSELVRRARLLSARGAACYGAEACPLRLEVVECSTQMRYVRLQVSFTVADSVRGMRGQLEQMLVIARMAQSCYSDADSYLELERRLRPEFFSLALSEEGQAAVERLVAGDFEDIGRTPMTLCDLANLVNPAVEPALLAA